MNFIEKKNNLYRKLINFGHNSTISYRNNMYFEIDLKIDFIKKNIIKDNTQNLIPYA